MTGRLIDVGGSSHTHGDHGTNGRAARRAGRSGVRGALSLGTAILNIPLGASDQKLVAWWSDGGNQVTAIISMYTFVLAGLCFLAFLVQLRSRLLRPRAKPVL